MWFIYSIEYCNKIVIYVEKHSLMFEKFTDTYTKNVLFSVFSDIMKKKIFNTSYDTLNYDKYIN